jgi:hypothetical protein
MSNTTTVETREEEALGPLAGSYVLSDMSVQLSRVPKEDAAYGSTQVLMVMVDALLRDSPLAFR